ncbi:mitochondrial 54S ribosomal protein YmL35 [Rhodotorula toruloides]
MHRSRLLLRSCSRALSTSAPAHSASAAPAYRPPVEPGVLPAFDAAVDYIARDRQRKLDRIEQLAKEADVSHEQLEKLEVEAWSNDPETRWRAKNGLADFSKPVYRHLVERSWRNEGDLAILMQRVTQMNVTPDVVGDIYPEIDLRIQVAGETIEPGVFTLPAQTRERIEVTAQVFHAEEKLYTLLLVDPDVPDELNASFTTYAHWLIPNVLLSATTPLTLSALPAPALPYVPPHPQNGTPYHRYTLLLLSQPSPLSLPSFESGEIKRRGFSVREFVAQHGLEPKGVSFFRQVWDRDVSAIYKEVLQPKYARRAPNLDNAAQRPPKYESY